MLGSVWVWPKCAANGDLVTEQKPDEVLMVRSAHHHHAAGPVSCEVGTCGLLSWSWGSKALPALYFSPSICCWQGSVCWSHVETAKRTFLSCPVLPSTDTKLEQGAQVAIPTMSPPLGWHLVASSHDLGNLQELRLGSSGWAQQVCNWL